MYSQVQATGGGDVELPAVTQLSGSVLLTSDGAGSEIDLSELTQFIANPTASANPGSLAVTNQGTILDVDLTSLNGVNVTLGGTGTLATNQWATMTNSSLTIDGGAYTFPGLTDIDSSSLHAQAGSTLTLSAVTSYAQADSSGATSTFQASGVGTLLALPALATLSVTGAYWAGAQVQATGGGDVELPAVTQLSGSVLLTSDGA